MHQLAGLSFLRDAWMGYALNFFNCSSKLARSSFRFLFSAINDCFFASSSFLCFSKSSRTAFSLFSRAIIRLCGSSCWCWGCRVRNSSTETNGNEVYLCLTFYQFWRISMEMAYQGTHGNSLQALISPRRCLCS